jgi:flagellin-like protein
MNKRALSPIIATVLLISLVLVLASIIFLWARAFIPESVQKFDSPIEDACAGVVFEASYYNDVISVQNNGNTPLHGIQVGVKRGLGSLEYLEGSFTGPAIVAGARRDFPVTGINSNEELVIVPVLLGKISTGELRAYACGDSSARTIQA